MNSSKDKNLPVIFGEQIMNSKLVRRYQGENEIAPQYVRDSKETVWQAELNAQAEADRFGYAGVISDGLSYVSFSGKWYCLN